MNTMLAQTQIWQMHIAAGNEDFDNHQLASAITHYQRAIETAEELMQSECDFRHAAACLLVSHHNLADTYIEQSEINKATAELQSVHQKLLAWLETPAASNMELSLGLWATRKSYQALIAHGKRFGLSELIIESK